MFRKLPKCAPFPGPLSVLIMDNAKIHKGEDVVDLVESFGKLNVSIALDLLLIVTCAPIEEVFSKIKHWIYRHKNYYRATEGDRILYNIHKVLDIIDPSDAEGYFFYAGYF